MNRSLEYPLGICATPKCGRPAAWLSIPEGNVQGSTAPRRCTVCCDAIGAALETLLTKWVLTPVTPQNVNLFPIEQVLDRIHPESERWRGLPNATDRPLDRG